MDEGTERGELGLQTAAVALDEVHSVTQWYVWLFTWLVTAFGFMFCIKWIEIISHVVILDYM